MGHIDSLLMPFSLKAPRDFLIVKTWVLDDSIQYKVHEIIVFRSDLISPKLQKPDVPTTHTGIQ